MIVIPRTKYDAARHIAEGDLVSVDWVGFDNVNEVGIVLKVALDVRNEDHLCPSEEILVAEVYISGSVFVFDEDELTIIEKCNLENLCL